MGWDAPSSLIEEMEEIGQNMVDPWDKFVKSIIYIERQFAMLITPKLFKKRDFTIDDNLCFVLMPSGDSTLEQMYKDHVKKTVESCGLKCRRAYDIFSTNPIIEDIWKGINQARIIIAELTDRNPNVFYEVGICHTLGKDVILLTQSIDDVPFDLRFIRCIIYNYTPQGALKLEEALCRTIKSLLRDE